MKSVKNDKSKFLDRKRLIIGADLSYADKIASSPRSENKSFACMTLDSDGYFLVGTCDHNNYSACINKK
jgi:hypothetical protein